jgi:antitoxin YefM
VTHQNKDKKIKKRSSSKDELVFQDDHQGYDETAYLLKSPKNAIRLLESIDSLKEGKIIETSLSELPHK